MMDSALHYEIVETLGAGGMDVVYTKAHDTRLERFIARSLETRLGLTE